MCDLYCIESEIVKSLSRPGADFPYAMSEISSQYSPYTLSFGNPQRQMVICGETEL